MADSSADLTKLVPGFDFLQGLVKNAGTALPNIGQWVAPTLDPDELEKRIEELRTVQFWLEQNAKMLGATIQALEVQRMTLSTLKTMNVQMSDLRNSMRLPERSPPAAVAAAASEAAAPAAAKASNKTRSAGKSAAAEARVPAGVVDPMQWWGALTRQFTELAAGAIKDSARDASKAPAGALNPDSPPAKQAPKKSAKVARASAKPSDSSGGKRRPKSTS